MRVALAMVRSAFVLVVMTLLQPTLAWGAEVESGFYSGRVFRKLHIDRDHVAVRLSKATAGQAVTLGKRAQASFEMMGAVVVPRTALREGADILGYPVWFDKEEDAVAIMTHEIVLRLEPGASTDLVRREAGFGDIKRARFGTDIYLAKFASPMAALSAANALYKRKGVLYAHPNFQVAKSWRNAASQQAPTKQEPGTVVTSESSPLAEPLFAQQWHLENTAQFGGRNGADIHIKGAWEVTQGSADVLIAVLDGGFQINHPDLEGAIWRNQREIPGNRIDDDGNGYVDDINGWNFLMANNDVADGSVDDHGTAVAGLVGARANGRGVTGTCPQCRILPIVVSWEVADDAAAFYYALAANAAIATSSWGYAIGTPETDVVVDAIRETVTKGREGKGMITLFAMNNIDQDDCSGNHPDISSLPFVIAVSGSADTDKKVSFSAWGDCMKFLAPTYEMNRPGIVTIDLVGQRGYNNGRRPGDLADMDYTNDFGGTSAATPIAAGVFGLMLTANPDLTRESALDLLIRNTDKVHPELAHYGANNGFSRKYGYGRLNAERAVRAAHGHRRYSQSIEDTDGVTQ